MERKKKEEEEGEKQKNRKDNGTWFVIDSPLFCVGRLPFLFTAGLVVSLFPIAVCHSHSPFVYRLLLFIERDRESYSQGVSG